MTRRLAALASGLLLIWAATTVSPTGAQGATRPAPDAAVAAAFSRAVHHYSDPTRIRVTHTLRSQRNRSWSLVTGSYGRRGLWAAWTRRTSNASYRVVVFRTRDFDPGSRPPCDIRPAFSEPAC